MDAGPPTPPPERCDLPLDPWILPEGSGASVRPLSSPLEGVGGPNAHGKAGDFLLGNGRIRVVIQGEDRHIGANPWGGTILDADLVREGPGMDQFGEMGLLYNFGRTVRPTLFEIIADGSAGGPAILAASGRDAANDYLNIRNQLQSSLGAAPATDPYLALPLRITNYFILNPGESRVRYVTAFCNEGAEDVVLAVGDMTDPGFGVEFFNGQSCTGGFGVGGLCHGLDRASWFGYQGEGVAYGYAPWRPGSPRWPEANNAVLTVAGITGSVVGAPGLQGLLDWFNPERETRGGELRIAPGQTRVLARDFVVGRDLGEVASTIHATRAAVNGAEPGVLRGLVTSAGAPLVKARVTVEGADEIVSVFVTDAEGRFEGVVPPGQYEVSAWAPGRRPSPSARVSVSAQLPVEVSFEVPATRRLTVRVRDAQSGEPLPAKVTVLCSGACPAPWSKLNLYTDAVRDPLLDGIQLVGLVPVSGEATFELPASQYTLLVTRGPEYSIFPNGWPSVPATAVDLRHGDGELDAKLVRVVDTSGFLSADFHVHAVNSPDSAVDNRTRVLSFIAEGVDVLVATDHDYVTDFTPWVQELGAEGHIATVVGEEVSTMDFGHYNLFPMPRDESDPLTGGALDWAGGDGPTLTVRQIFEHARTRGVRTIHFNHPRGFLGGWTHLRVDTDTLASHADPADFRMETPPDATPEDTKIMSADFDALEVLNSAEDAFDWAEMFPKFNDWFTLLSRGLKITGTGVSDTHTRNAQTGGYWRTWVQTGTEGPLGFDPWALSDALNAQKAVASNGPFVRVRAVRVDASGAETSLPAGLGEVLPASEDDVKVTVDIQAPEYLDVTRVELYMHTPGDDGSCPIDPGSPIARTTRVACDGKPNRNWPLQGITARREISLGPGNLETVATIDGVSYRRWRAEVEFQLPAPVTDNWIVAFVYGSKPLFPLVFEKQEPGTAVSPILPFALTNPIYVDADGGGFDRPPFRAVPMGPKAPLPRPSPVERRNPPTEAELIEAWAPLAGGH